MPRPPGKDPTQITFRVVREWLPRADAIAKEMCQPGLQMTRTSVFRIALAQGLDWVEREAGITNEKPVRESESAAPQVEFRAAGSRGRARGNRKTDSPAAPSTMPTEPSAREVPTAAPNAPSATSTESPPTAECSSRPRTQR